MRGPWGLRIVFFYRGWEQAIGKGGNTLCDIKEAWEANEF